MKPVLFHTIHPNLAGKLEVLAVTSRQGTRLFGRNLRHCTATARSFNCHGHFQTADEALSAIDELEAIFAKYRPMEEQAQLLLKSVNRAKRRATDHVIKQHCQPLEEAA